MSLFKGDRKTHRPSLPSQLHVQGKTDQAKTDLARLAKIRQEREAAQAKRKAEAEGQLTLPLPFHAHNSRTHIWHLFVAQRGRRRRKPSGCNRGAKHLISSSQVGKGSSSRKRQSSWCCTLYVVSCALLLSPWLDLSSVRTAIVVNRGSLVSTLTD